MAMIQSFEPGFPGIFRASGTADGRTHRCQRTRPRPGRSAPASCWNSRNARHRPLRRWRRNVRGRLGGSAPGPQTGYRMEADALGRTVIDGHEDAGRPLSDRHRGRQVRPPHHVGGRRGDRSIVGLRAVCVARAGRGLEVVLPHEPSPPLLRGADPLDPQRRPSFPVPLAMKR